MPGRSKCCNCHQVLDVKPPADGSGVGCIDYYLPCSRCFPADAVITKEQITKLENEVALLRRCESESAGTMKIIERLLQVVRSGVYRARESDYQKGFSEGNRVGTSNGRTMALREVTENEAIQFLSPTRCRYAAKILPMLQCALDEGHEGDCQSMR